MWTHIDQIGIELAFDKFCVVQFFAVLRKILEDFRLELGFGVEILVGEVVDQLIFVEGVVDDGLDVVLLRRGQNTILTLSISN